MPVDVGALVEGLPNARTVFLVVITLACLGVGGLALAARLLFPLNTAQGGQTTTTLADTPPAVINLLVNDLQLTDDAATAVVLGLARRGVIEFVDYGDADEVLFLRQPDALPTSTYEKQVLDFVGGLPLLNAGVPLAAVRATIADDGWWKRFRDAVSEQARIAGLVAQRYPARLVWAVQGGLGLCVVLGVLGLGDSENPKPSDPAGWAELSTFVAVGLAFLALRRVDRKALRYTALGRDWAAFWLGSRQGHEQSGSFADVPPAAVAVWGDHLVAAAALGVAREASQRLQLAVGDGSSVWYVANARWVHARVRHPDPPWGASPGSQLRAGFGQMVYSFFVICGFTFFVFKVLTTGDGDGQAVATVVGWLIDRVAFWRAPSWSALVPALVVLVVAVMVIGFFVVSVRAVTQWLAALADLFLRRTERGWVASLRPGWIVIGAGHEESLIAYRIPSRFVDNLVVGDVVELTATRFLGHVQSLRSSA